MFNLYRKTWAAVGFILCLFSVVYAYSGDGNGTPAEPCQISNVSDWNDLMKTSSDWNKYFIMTADINLQSVPLTPVGNATTNFTGVFNGDGYIVSNAIINMAGSSYVGLFGRVAAAGRISNLGVEDINITGGTYVGGLVGRHHGIITECYVTGKVVGSSSYVGGMVGGNYGSIIDCYSMDTVDGGDYVGGLVGSNSSAASDFNTCYSTGLVTGSGTNVGGLVGYNYGDVNDSFWDVNTSDCDSSDGGTGKTTVEMHDINTFLNAGWDFVTPIWKICQGTNYPKLDWQEPLTGDFGCPDGVDIYDFIVFVDQWLLEELSKDIAPDGGDGIVNFLDWAVFANGWQGDINELADFASQWLKSSTYSADFDIAPAPDGDGIINFIDFAIFANNWFREQ